MSKIARTVRFALLPLAAAALLAGNAFAQEAVYELPQPAVSSLSRAEVRAELAAARSAGTLQSTEADFQKLPVLASTKSRVAVRNEVLAAGTEALHEIDREPQGFDAPVAQVRPAGAPAVIAALR